MTVREVENAIECKPRADLRKALQLTVLLCANEMKTYSQVPMKKGKPRMSEIVCKCYCFCYLRVVENDSRKCLKFIWFIRLNASKAFDRAIKHVQALR